MTEIWKEIDDYTHYKVSNLGSVIGPKGIKAQFPNKGGYMHVVLTRGSGSFGPRVKRLIVSRIVARAFHPDWTEDCVVGYKDQNKSNLAVSNLVISGSTQDRIHVFLRARGERGATFCKTASKWRAQIRIDNKKKALGYFDTKELALASYRSAYRVHFGREPWEESEPKSGMERS